MSALLNKRLARSLWRTKLRLLAVVLMVFVGVFAGITFGGYAHNLGGMYDTMQADDENGANLADLWIDNRSAALDSRRSHFILYGIGNCMGFFIRFSIA